MSDDFIALVGALAEDGFAFLVTLTGMAIGMSLCELILYGAIGWGQIASVLMIVAFGYVATKFMKWIIEGVENG